MINGVGTYKRDTGQFENPVQPETAYFAFDQGIHVVKPHRPDHHEGQHRCQPGKGKRIPPEGLAYDPEQDQARKAGDGDKGQDRHDLKVAPVGVPALNLGRAACAGGGERLEIQLLVDRQERQQKHQAGPEKPLAGRVRRQFAPNGKRQGAGQGIGENGQPAHEAGIADTGMPTVERAIGNLPQFGPGDERAFFHDSKVYVSRAVRSTAIAAGRSRPVIPDFDEQPRL